MKKKVLSPAAVIILVTTAVILASTAITVGFSIIEYSGQKKEELRKETVALAAFIERVIEDQEYSGLREYVTTRKETFQFVLSSGRDTIAYYIADSTGKMIQYGCSDEGAIGKMGSYMPEKITDESGSPGFARILKNPGEYMEGAKIAAVTKIHDSKTGFCGYLVMASKLESRRNFSLFLLYIGALAFLWIGCFTWIFQSNYISKIVDPLKKIRESAMKCAGGNFTVKVDIEKSSPLYMLGRDFNSMVDSLKVLNDSRNDFMSSVSHDLRTPMTSIAGFVDCILTGAIPRSQVPKYLENIKSEVMRLSRLIGIMLDISRIQTGERRFLESEFDICELLRTVTISFEKKIESKNLDVRFITRPDNISVRGDRDAINQVVYNLIDNAVKFSPENGTLTVFASEKFSEANVVIVNNGEGIDKEDLPFVFERFYKADKSRGKDRSGFGLGLYISQQIIRAHGRRIVVSSEPGKDVLFGFSLPVWEKGAVNTIEKSDYDD